MRPPCMQSSENSPRLCIRGAHALFLGISEQAFRRISGRKPQFLSADSPLAGAPLDSCFLKYLGRFHEGSLVYTMVSSFWLCQVRFRLQGGPT